MHATSRPRGFSLLEVVLLCVLLAVGAAALGQTFLTALAATRESGEYAAVVAAARQKMEELAATRFEDLVKKYGASAPTVGNTFPVMLDQAGTEINASGTKAYGLELPGYNNLPAGEIVIITDESNPPSLYGRSLPPDGNRPGGVSFSGLPMDLNGDGNVTSGNVWGGTPATNLAIRLPVGVVIRWPGARGPERYELWTIMSKY